MMSANKRHTIEQFSNHLQAAADTICHAMNTSADGLTIGEAFLLARQAHSLIMKLDKPIRAISVQLADDNEDMVELFNRR